MDTPVESSELVTLQLSVSDLSNVEKGLNTDQLCDSEIVPKDCVNNSISGDLNNPQVHYDEHKNKILPRRLSITYPDPIKGQSDVEMEVCCVINSECEQVSVIRAEGSEEQMILKEQHTPSNTSTSNDNISEAMKTNDLSVSCPKNSSVQSPLSVTTPNSSSIKVIESTESKKRQRGKKSLSSGSKLNKVVDKLILAKSNNSEIENNPSILQNLLLTNPENELQDNQCLQTLNLKISKKTASKLLPLAVPESIHIPSELSIIPHPSAIAHDTSVNICDNLPKMTNCTIPSPVVNRLRKLGTVVEIETPSSVESSTSEPDTETRYTELIDSMAQVGNILKDLTKKKKKKSAKKPQENDQKVPLNNSIELSDTEVQGKFHFKVDKKHIIQLPGKKVYFCDICNCIYHRGFSLKRHYLKTHINSKHVSARDLHNCGIVIDRSAIENGTRSRPTRMDSPQIVTNLSQPNNIPDLYRCHICTLCYPVKADLKFHMTEHPPFSVQTINKKQFSKTYTCEVCLLHYQKKKQYLKHIELCKRELEVSTYHCLYCENSFTSLDLKKKHQWKLHHPKKRLHPCYICKMKMFKDLSALFKHLLTFHNDEYYGCLLCKLRFAERSEQKKHKKEKHAKEKKQDTVTLLDDEAEDPEQVLNERSNNNKCTFCSKTFNNHDNMSKHLQIAHNNSLKKNKKDLKTSVATDHALINSTSHQTSCQSSLLDPETLFYSRISINIRENLLHHLDGKLDSQEVIEHDLKQNASQLKRHKVLNFSASFPSTKETFIPETITASTKEDSRPSHLIINPKVPWEKFNFPKNYDGRCGLTSYIKDMSHLDIATQLTMRRNLQRFNCSLGQELNKDNINEDIPSGLSLERQGAACAETYGDPKATVLKDDKEIQELSGEWVRPRTYICAACGIKSTNLWEIEDHKASLHPNVWCPHVEVIGEHNSVWDWVYYRRLPTENAVDTFSLPHTSNKLPQKCTKCNYQSASIPDLHRHILECGGDTTWMSTMLAVTSPGSRRSRKWRPFGSRRRRQQCRRGMKRNIPNTPAKHVCGKIRTKPGDTDTIQKMIANLPPKRVTRKVIDEIDIKTRSQATINSVPFNAYSYTNKPSSSHNGKSSKTAKNTALQKNTSVLGKKGKSSETVINVQNGPKPETSNNQSVGTVKLENLPLQNMETEVMVQHSDILTSLQMIPVPKKEVFEDISVNEPPIERETVLAAMREAMGASADVPSEKMFNKKSKDKKKKETTKVEDFKTCIGCGMKFENSTACQRHKKKCVYWKKENSIDGSSTNKCIHCNTVFPYLMALKTHHCNIPKLGEDPSMPELSKVEPVEEIKTEGSEDIPVLSPEDMKQVSNNVSYDINRDRRLLLLQSTIEKVADESFVIEEFHLKSKKGFSLLENMDFDKSIVAEEKKNGDLVVDNTNKIILEDKKTMKKKKFFNKNCIGNNNEALNSSSNDQSEVNDISFEIKNKTLGKANSQSVKKGNRVLKVAINNITKGKLIHYKGTKKVGRPLKSNIILNAVPNRCVKNNTNRFNRKLKAIVRKRRSTNLDLLLKESEKLGEDGSLVVGKRRRIDSLNSVDVDIVGIKIKMEDTNETIQEPLVKKKPGRPKKNKDATLISCDNFKVGREIEGKVLDIGDITLASPKNVSAQKIKSKVIKNIDKCEKGNNEGLLLESKMKQTKLDHILRKSLINSTLIKNNEKISENEKKSKGKPKLKQSTLDSMRDLNPTSSNCLIISHSHEKNSLDGGNITENSFIAIKQLNKIESKVKNKRIITDKETLISEASSSHTNNGKDEMNHDFEDLDEIPLSRVKIESVELNADEHSKDSRKGSTQKIKSKALLSSKNRYKKVKKGSIFHNHTLQVIDSNIRGQNSSEKNYVDYGLNANENFKVSKVNRLENINTKNNITENKNVNHEIQLNKKEMSNDLELNTINEVVATYTTEESTETTLKKKSRGRPTCSKQIDMSFNKIKSKIEVFNDNKNCGVKPKVIKKNNASGQSEFTINTTVIESTVIQNDGIKIEPQEETSANSGLEDNKSRDHFLLIKSASGDLKESFNKSHFDADEDESLSSLKRKLLSAKITINESNIENKKEELIKKLNANNISILKSNTNCAELKRKINKINLSHLNNLKSNKTNNLAHLGVPNIGNITTIKEKLKKRRKLKRILKSNNIDMTNHILKRVTKYKLNLNDQLLKKASKCTMYQPLDSKRKIGIGGSKWKVSVVDSASESNALCNLTRGSKDGVKIEDDSMHLCNICNEKFTTLESLYEHQSTLSHKQTLKEKPKEIEMCRNTLVNVLNDLEKKTLQVAKVMNQLQHRDSTDSMTEDHRSASTSNLSDVSNLPSNSQNNTIFKKEQTDPSADDAWASQSSQNQDWDSQDWAMVRATPNWENQQQPWESESNLSSGCASSLGSILDSVNKILTEQEVSAAPAPQYTMADLQKAMGASDEEMAMLEQLGEGSLQEDYVYDNSRPGADIWPKEEGPTFMDLDNQESNPNTNTSSSQDAIVPVESQSSTSVQGTESDIMRQCRGLLGRPRRLLSDYELREMVCPTCNKHFLGLSALQTHVAWSHCAPVNSTRPGSGLKRRALLNVCEDIDKRLVCFVCKEIVSTPSHLDVHIQAQHMKKNAVHDNLSANKEEGAEKLKSKMSNALGGLLDRALNNLLGAKQKNAEIDAQPELGALQLLGKLCAVRRRVGNENMKLSGDTLQLLGRLRAAAKRKEMRLGFKGTLGFNSKMSGVNKANLSASVSSDVSSNPEIKPTNLLDHLAVCSNDIDQRPYACPICDVRFLIPSVRNRHIARAHGKYGRKYEEEVQEQIAEQMAMDTYSNSTDDVCDTDWRDAFFPSLDDDQTCDDEVEMNPLCSDCGLSFRSIHEVIRHRKEDHPRRFSAEDKSLITKHDQTGTNADHNTDTGCQLPAYDNISIDNLPISDNVVDSTSSNQTQYHGDSGSTQREDQLCKSLLTDKSIRDDTKEKDELEEEEEFPFDSEMNQLNLQDETDTTNRSLIEDVTKKYGGFDFLLEKGDLESGFDDKKKYQSVLSKRINNRKGRLSYMAEESVRVKAEAALKELNQQRRNKSFLNNARWGVNALKFVKQPCSSSQFNYPSPSTSPSKLRFSTLSDKRLKITNLDDSVPLIKSEMEDTPSGADEKSDVYDFNDDDFLVDRKPFVPIKDLPDLSKSKVQLTDEGNTVS